MLNRFVFFSCLPVSQLKATSVAAWIFSVLENLIKKGHQTHLCTTPCFIRKGVVKTPSVITLDCLPCVYGSYFIRRNAAKPYWIYTVNRSQSPTLPVQPKCPQLACWLTSLRWHGCFSSPSLSNKQPAAAITCINRCGYMDASRAVQLVACNKK